MIRGEAIMARQRGLGWSVNTWAWAVVSAVLAVSVALSISGGVWILASVILVAVCGLLAGSRAWVLGLTYLAILLGSSFDPSATGAAFYLRFVMYGVLIVWSLFVVGRARNLSLLEGIFYTAAGLFCIIGLISISWSIAPGLSAARTIGLALLITAGMASSVSNWTDLSRIRSDLKVLGLISVVVGATNLVAMLVSDSSLLYSADRFRGVLQNPNTTGVIVAFALPIVLGMMYMDRARRYVWTAGGFILLLSLGHSQSRGGIVAALFGCVAVLILIPSRTARRYLMIAAGVAIAVLIVVILLPDVLPGSLQELAARFRGEGKAQGGSGRLAAWSLATEIWVQRPWLGWGFGTVELSFGVRSVEIQQVFVGLHPHNAFLETLLDIGVLGLSALSAALLAAIRAMKNARRDPVVATLTGCVASGATLMFVESGLTSAGSILGMFFWLLAAALVTGSALIDSRQEASTRS